MSVQLYMHPSSKHVDSYTLSRVTAAATKAANNDVTEFV